jgi:hypothetical protein
MDHPTPPKSPKSQSKNVFVAAATGVAWEAKVVVQTISITTTTTMFLFFVIILFSP